ncbi:MAG: hypothetical protein KBH08_06320, partial [Brachymonas sp.]|nr:hypothetical protein [Brachymonas sp.]
VVVLPTPPFWLAMQKILAMVLRLARRNDENPAAGVALHKQSPKGSKPDCNCAKSMPRGIGMVPIVAGLPREAIPLAVWRCALYQPGMGGQIPTKV